MTEKRFKISIGEFEEENIIDTVKKIEITKISDMCIQMNTLYDENEQLKKEKERYKRLSKIRQQQIDNRILTIKEFINNCSDNKVRSTLKELFYSEVNEYDLSLKYRELTDEIEQLKKDLEEYCDFSLHDVLDKKNKEIEQLRLQLNNCSAQRNEFHRGARENANRVGKLKKENEELKSEIQKLKNVSTN